MAVYNFVFESVIVVSEVGGRSLEDICRDVDNGYQPPVLDDELFELDSTEIIAIGNDGGKFYTYLKDEVPSVLSEPVTLSVRNLIAPVVLPEMSFDELVEYIEDAVFEESHVDSRFGVVVDELFEVYDEHGNMLK